MPKTLIVDTRFPATDLPTSDPANPKNLILDTTMIQNQASADTKYDIIPPPRIDQFVDYNGSKSMLIGIIMVVLIALYLALIPRPLYQRIILAAVAVFGLHHIAGKLENRTV